MKRLWHLLQKWFRYITDSVAVALLTAMFIVFILQIFSRYVLNAPIGWTVEACLLCWLFLVFWGCAFNVNDHQHVRFDILYEAAPVRLRKVFSIISAVAIIAGFAVSFKPTLDFVSFMKIESTSLLKFRFDYVFAIYIVFSVGVMIRYGQRILAILRSEPGVPPSDLDLNLGKKPDPKSSMFDSGSP